MAQKHVTMYQPVIDSNKCHGNWSVITMIMNMTIFMIMTMKKALEKMHQSCKCDENANALKMYSLELKVLIQRY